MSFEATDFLTLDLINREEKLPQWARDRMPALLKSGVVERIGRKYMLSRNYYEFVDRKGVYTRKRGFDRETNKLLLLKHIRDNRENGSRLNDLRQVLPALSRRQVQALIAALKKQNKVWMVGKTSAARWYPHGTSKGQNNE